MPFPQLADHGIQFCHTLMDLLCAIGRVTNDLSHWQFGLTLAIHHPKSDLEQHSHFPGAQPFSSTVVVHMLHYPAALVNIHSEMLVFTAPCGPAAQGQRTLKVTGAHLYWI